MACSKDDPYMGFSCCHVCARKYAKQMQGDIDRLTKERDERANDAALVRISNKALQRDLQEMTRERDEQAEAKRRLAREVRASRVMVVPIEQAPELVSRERLREVHLAVRTAREETDANFIAAAAVKEAF